MAKLRNDLFELIKSLDRNEKGYFKKYTLLHSAGSKNSMNYIKLFDAIDAMKDYNETELKTLFKGEKFVTQLFVTKNYLYTTLLKSLRSYATHSTSLMAILTNYQNAEILVQKGHYSKALEYIHKAKQTSLENEYFGFVNELIELEKSILNVLRKENTFKTVAVLNSEKKRTTRILQNEMDHIELSFELVSMRYKYGNLIPENKLKRVKSILGLETIKKETDTFSVFSKGIRSSIKAISYDMTNQSSLAHTEMKTGYNLLKTHPFTVRKNPAAFFTKAHNVITSLVRQHKYEELNTALNEISRVEDEYKLTLNPKLKGHVLEITLRSKMVYYINTLQFEEGIKFLDIAIKQIEIQKKNISSEAIVSFYFIAANLLIIMKRYKDAVVYLNKILVFSPSVFNKNETLVAQYLLLIVHYELKRQDLLTYVSGLFKHNESIEALDFLKAELPLIDTKKKEKEIFSEFKRLLLKSERKKFLLLFFDFLSYAESKIQKRSYAEILKQKANSMI